jgi:pyrroline-5-carboxylate reductase
LGANTQVVLIGFGNMGQALVRGWLARGWSRAAIQVVDPAPGAAALAAELGVTMRADGAAAVAAAAVEVVVLAVKPNQVAAVLAGASAASVARPVFLSIAAGKTLAQLEAALPAGVAVVRAMPNTPAAIGQGMTVLTANAAVTVAQRALCGELMAAVGSVAWLADEQHMDAVTAVSGSGPAYVFLLIECLQRAATELGLETSLAQQLALATVAGAAAYAATTAVEPAELRRRVTSPNGTTQAALDILMAEPGLRELLARAVRAAAARSRQLSTA